MATCFVIQPFDRGKFDRRYKDTFKPAIEAAGFEPYRVDEDPSVSIPIEQIEKGIREAAVCFIEITTDKPNVWFELGYAIACSKSLVMVCEKDARPKFPFDVQHRNIIVYDTDAASDYTTLGKEIIERLKAIDKTEVALEKLSKEPPLTDFKGLSAYERFVITAIVGNLSGVGRATPEYIIRKEAGKNGLTDFAISLGLQKLSLKQFITHDVSPPDEQWGDPYLAYSLTDKGWQWIVDNEDQFVLQRRSPPPPPQRTQRPDPDLDAEPDDIPF
jgi:hypothetical protein